VGTEAITEELMETVTRNVRENDLAGFLWDTGAALVEDVERYLASERGRQVRAALALGLITGAPMLVKLPWVKNTPVGRLIMFAGGAALIVKLGEALRDWDPEQKSLVG
jgi:hypothetical protein